MKYRNGLEEMSGTCVAFGEFDGVHRGHLAVLEALVREGKKKGLETAAVSLYSESGNKKDGVLTTEEEKAYYMEKAGVDNVISVDMDNNPADAGAIIKKLGAKTVVVGACNKAMEEIKKAADAAGADLIAVDTVSDNGEAISSEMVRKAFLDCDFEKVTALCGHTYVMIGKVEHGKALGRTVGMPTANLGVSDTKLKPPSGVYATMTTVDEDRYQGLTNIGPRPSVDDMPLITIETFLLDFARDIYGKTLVMEVHLHIRGVKKFDNLELVQQQVQKDLAQVKDYLNSQQKAV